MEHAAHRVDVLDIKGQVVGTKIRREVVKATDIVHTVFVLPVTPKGEIVLGVIPAREDLPNFYTRLMGTPVATMRRNNETPLHAALRGVERELFIDDAKVHLLGEKMLSLPEGRHMLATFYYMVADAPHTYSVIDIDTLVVVTPQQLRNLVLKFPHELAPTFRQLWDAYHEKLPI